MVKMSDKVSETLFERASPVIPGGVNSPVRAFRAVGGAPSSSRARRARSSTAPTGASTSTTSGSWGPAILGHAHPGVIDAVKRAADKRALVRRADRARGPLRRAVRNALPVHRQAALRVERHRGDHERHPRGARLHGARRHRQVRGLLPRSRRSPAREGGQRPRDVRRARLGGRPRGHRAGTRSRSRSTIVPRSTQLFAERGKEIAAVIVEPVVGNMGCVPPEPGFLASIIELCRQHGALSIFDEVMTGCRLAPGGAQERFGLTPDMTALGKIVGGGMPLAGLRRRGRRHERHRAARPGLPGRHAERKPGRRERRARDARAPDPRALRKLEATSASLEEGLTRASRTAEVRRLRAARGIDDHRVLHEAARCGRGPTPPRATPSDSPRFTRGCLGRASIGRRRNSRRRSWGALTRRTTSRAPSKWPRTRSSRSGEGQVMVRPWMTRRRNTSTASAKST